MGFVVKSSAWFVHSEHGVSVAPPGQVTNDLRLVTSRIAFDPSFLAPVRSIIPSFCWEICRALLGWTDEGVRPYAGAGATDTTCRTNCRKLTNRALLKLAGLSIGCGKNCFTWRLRRREIRVRCSRCSCRLRM